MKIQRISLLIGLTLIVLLAATGCSSVNTLMKESTAVVKFTKSDFVFSDRVTAKATIVKIFGIDWARMFSKKAGNVQDGSLSVLINKLAHSR